MTRSTWTLVAAGALAATVVVWSAAASDVELWHEPPPGDRTEQPREVEVEEFERPPALPELPEESEPGEGPDLSLAVRIVLIVAGIAVLALVVRLLVRWRPRPRRGRPAPITPLPEVDLAEAIDDVAEGLRRRLARGTPRNAIVECWVVLEDAVATAGRARRPAETSAEFTARVIGEHSVDAGAIGQLAALYREARFSRHELTEHHRDLAVSAVDALLGQLRVPGDEAVAPA